MLENYCTEVVQIFVQIFVQKSCRTTDPLKTRHFLFGRAALLGPYGLRKKLNRWIIHELFSVVLKRKTRWVLHAYYIWQIRFFRFIYSLIVQSRSTVRFHWRVLQCHPSICHPQIFNGNKWILKFFNIFFDRQNNRTVFIFMRGFGNRIIHMSSKQCFTRADVGYGCDIRLELYQALQNRL